MTIEYIDEETGKIKITEIPDEFYTYFTPPVPEF